MNFIKLTLDDRSCVYINPETIESLFPTASVTRVTLRSGAKCLVTETPGTILAMISQAGGNQSPNVDS